MEWTSELNVGVSFMDDDHEHAADIIKAIGNATSEDLAEKLKAYLEHCREHFVREEEMMLQVGFFAYDCHSGEHERVLGDLERKLEKLKADSSSVNPKLLHDELEDWLLNHRNTMDLVTANFARSQGYQAA
ncbi:hemerythrin family protein [Terasakiella sp. A23]|uniref:bacteriohemerythrin n=1 Tax=Terasakiella sp. FCG-A23 TaxID=3080561 RepID=UPI0029542FEE|nr:hemerythrin family protein [Terasakiella sp. A23]MDV7338469.1 hemerythrin family protein [Terasakiella sp. A23]